MNHDDLEGLTNAGVVECMVRNKAVAEYITQLERENELAKTAYLGMKAENAALRVERDEYRDDAVRWRRLKWMFDYGGVTIRVVGEVDKLGIPREEWKWTDWEPLQAAIDAAKEKP